MKNKKVIIISVIVVALLIIGFLVYNFLTKEDKITTLNLFEKQWIESNKHNVIDMSIIDEANYCRGQLLSIPTI